MRADRLRRPAPAGHHHRARPPDDYPNRGFGEVVSAYSGTVRGVFGSRVAASAGTGTPFSTFPLLVGEELRLDTPLLDGCDEEAPCGAGAGVSLVGVPRWSDREMCLAAASPDTGEIRLRCEDDVTRIEIANGPSGQRFGESAAGLPEHVFARAVFGAPGAFGGRGSVYRLPDRAPPVEIDLSEGFGAGGELGSAVAALAVDADTVLLAAAAPSGSGQARDRGAERRRRRRQRRHARARLRRRHDDRLGMALALGDLNGDGRAEVAIGSGQEPGRLEAVRVCDGATLPPAGTCTGTWPVAIELSCPDLEGVDCAAGSFGAALSIGDVDGDGTGDLIVGTPMAEVDGGGRRGRGVRLPGCGEPHRSGSDRGGAHRLEPELGRRPRHERGGHPRRGGQRLERRAPRRAGGGRAGRRPRVRLPLHGPGR
ncbi:MAG: FG-GAP repeat protein [Sandaracinaceae bacterium]|nr:FG-GAP repeat protein [Sandaracinaceae bacterium]